MILCVRCRVCPDPSAGRQGARGPASRGTHVSAVNKEHKPTEEKQIWRRELEARDGEDKNLEAWDRACGASLALFCCRKDAKQQDCLGILRLTVVDKNGDLALRSLLGAYKPNAGGWKGSESGVYGGNRPAKKQIGRSTFVVGWHLHDAMRAGV